MVRIIGLTVAAPLVLLVPVVLLAPASAAEVPGAAVSQMDASGVLGRKVLSRTGKEIGRVVNVLVDPAGKPRAVVIDFGGFMGVGSRKIAVDWGVLRFPPGEDAKSAITVDLAPEQMQDAPEYTGDGKPAPVVVPPATH